MSEAILLPSAKTRAAASSSPLLTGFRKPPVTHGPVPFYWWAGEPLDRERIAWQLDELCAHGVRQTVVSYPHGPDGATVAGDPPLFSPEWWDLFRWFLDACRARGMTAGFQDYTISEPLLEEVARGQSDMEGGQMGCLWEAVAHGGRCRLAMEEGCRLVAAAAYPLENDTPAVERRIPLAHLVSGGILDWEAPSGDWLITMVFAWISPFDPLHPDSGKLAIGKLYEPFERECPDHIGSTLNVFFQDELNFGGRMPFWSNRLFEAFSEAAGYSLLPVLPALWTDFGSRSEKLRLDFADAVSRRIEDRYFKPVFEWHESRGITFGQDNGGRGQIAVGRSYYGDYFRAMRWFSAPGCDDPRLDGSRAFKGLKVNSSIAHLYRRPRVWLEGFHSSGWGTAPAEIVAAVNEDLVYGASVVNLHGLYYSTRGGWWEWAPPDFHFRQPYWKHCSALNSYFTRLCWLLTRGVHRCDVAIVYPIDALDAAPCPPGRAPVIAHTEHSPIGMETFHDPEESAFGIGKYLFDHACDFDFIDADSLRAARPSDGELRVADARYRVLVIPPMVALRHSTASKALEFVRAGGIVIACGRLPRASDHAGRDDPGFDALISGIFGSTDESADHCKEHPGGGAACFVLSGHANVLEIIDRRIERDVRASAPVQVLHRHTDEAEIHFVFNPADCGTDVDLEFREPGAAETWDPWTGEVEPLASPCLSLGAREGKLLVIRKSGAPAAGKTAAATMCRSTLALDGPWDCRIHPTLDNRHGDFSLPPGGGLIGPQARRFRWQDETDGSEPWQAPDFDDAGWREATFSFGPQLECTGPLPPGSDADAQALAGDLPWRPYEFSRRWGIERDPFLTDWLSGPHGLKGAVPDEFLDFHSDRTGACWYVRGDIVAPQEGQHTLIVGARCACQLWIDGRVVLPMSDALPPGRHAPWNIPYYDCQPRETKVRLAKGSHKLVIKLVQPDGQRTRAFVALDPASPDAGTLALRWFRKPDAIRPCLLAPPIRRAIRFRFASPPGAREFTFVARGRSEAWCDGRQVLLETIEAVADGCTRYRAVIPQPSRESGLVALRVAAPRDSHGGDALPEPVNFVCGDGRMSCGDWRVHGLSTYSGAVEYRRTIPWDGPGQAAAAWLDLGDVAATAEVRLNGSSVAILIAPPWRCDLAPFLRSGDNDLSVTVASTLGNHYSVGIPTPYSYPEQNRSGLIGPVTLSIHS